MELNFDPNASSHDLYFVPESPQYSHTSNAPQVMIRNSSSNSNASQESGTQQPWEQEPLKWIKTERYVQLVPHNAQGLLLHEVGEQVVTKFDYWQRIESPSLVTSLQNRAYEELLRIIPASQVPELYELQLARLKRLRKTRKNDLDIYHEWCSSRVKTRSVINLPEHFSIGREMQSDECVRKKMSVKVQAHTLGERSMMRLLEQCEDILKQNDGFSPAGWQIPELRPPRWIEGVRGWTGLMPEDITDCQT